MDKRVVRFLKRKTVIEVLGKVECLQKNYENELIRIFNEFGYRNIEDFFKSLSIIIKNNLPNLYRRFLKLKKCPASPTKFSLYLRYGRKFEEVSSQHGENRNKNSILKKSYWISMGLSEKSAKEKVSEIQRKNAALSANKLRGTSEFTHRSVTFWLKKGFSIDEAKEKVRIIQTTNGISYYVSKGLSLDEAIKLQNERNHKWLQTLDSLPEDEKELINLKKSHTVEGYMARGYDKNTSLKKSIEYFSKRNNYSCISQDFFDSVVEHYSLSDDIVYYQTKNYEYQINGKCVDFYLKSKKLVIEFYGDWWHMNPEKYIETDICYGKPAKEIWQSDKCRVDKISQSDDVKNIIIIWESEYRKNPKLCIEKLKGFM